MLPSSIARCGTTFEAPCPIFLADDGVKLCGFHTGFLQLLEGLSGFDTLVLANVSHKYHALFASTTMKGKQPLWPDSLWKRHGKPAVKAAKVTKNVTYHTFRHTFGTLLNASGENPKVVQELLRHATLKVTTDTYMQALAPEKRQVQAKLVMMVRGKKAATA